MQVVSGASYAPKVHFEAPPSPRVRKEMYSFLEWFNSTGPGTNSALPALTRGGIAHLYFESIHPFEDGNGRIGRAVAEKALFQGFGQPIIVALARSILAHDADYYRGLGTDRPNVGLAPLYDILSTVYYPEISRTMAMKLGDEYSSEKVSPHSFEQLAGDARLATPLVTRRVTDMIEAIRTVLPQMHSDVITRSIAERILERCELSQGRFQR